MRLLCAALLLLGAASLSAANHYILDGGSGDCSDWTNACDALPATLTRGDTYYIGDGSYGGYTFDDAQSGTTWIYVHKATAADHGTETGWVSTYGDGQATFTGALLMNTYYLEMDGQVGYGASWWKDYTAYGFVVDVSGGGNTNAIGHTFGAGRDYNHITIAHVEIMPADNTSGSGDSINFPNQQADNGDYTFSYLWLHAVNRVQIYVGGGTSNNVANVLVEYVFFEQNGLNTPLHSEIFAWRGIDNATVRWSVFKNFRSTGGSIIGNGLGVEFYGNVFWGPAGPSGNGAIGTWSSNPGYDVQNFKICNNTFYDLGGSATMKLFPTVNSSSGHDARNNVWVDSAPDSGSIFGGSVSHDYNAFYSSGGTYSESNGQALGSSLLSDPDNGDFTLSGETAAGDEAVCGVAALPGNAYDMDGVQRGSSGTWSRGAFEYGGSAPPPAYDGPTWHILDGGSGDGSDWDNALDDLPSSLTRGDTYYVADGTYAAYDFDDVESGSQSITVIKATALAHGSGTGWSLAYGDGTAAFGRLDISSSYWTIDGNTNANGVYGFTLSGCTAGECIEIEVPSGAIGTINLYDISANVGGVHGDMGIRVQSVDDLLLQNVEVYSLDSNCVNLVDVDTVVMDHLYCHTLTDDGYYGAALAVNLSTTSSAAVTLRNSTFDWDQWQLLVFGSGTLNGLTVHGNLMYGGGVSGQCVVGSGDPDIANLAFYNNSCVGMNVASIDFGANAAGAAANNVFYDVPDPVWDSVSHDYDWFQTGIATGGESNAQTGSDPFADSGNDDYHLAAATTAGDDTIGAAYATDLDGQTRGGDGVWDRGAYEYVAPAPPTYTLDVAGPDNQDVGTYAITGYDTDFLRDRIMIAEAGSYVITGSDVDFYTGTAPPDPATDTRPTTRRLRSLGLLALFRPWLGASAVGVLLATAIIILAIRIKRIGSRGGGIEFRDR